MSVFGDLEALRQRPIPLQERARVLRQNYRAWPIERGAHDAEPLVKLSDFGIDGENYYYSERNPPYWGRAEGAIPDLVLRLSVAKRLQNVNARLGAAGLMLHIFDGWRPTAVQAYFHDVWMPNELRRRRPELSGDGLRAEVERYWAAPTENPNSPAPHATGAASDLTLRWSGGDFLWMGSIFDDVTANAHRDRFERLETLSYSDEEARANRRLLHWIMSEQGFAGHPDEWWHFSWGDQTWAKLTNAPRAHYGQAVWRSTSG